MKKNIAIFLSVVTAIILTTCESPTQKPLTPAMKNVTISWGIKSSQTRMILPASYPSPATYSVVLQSSNGSDLSQTGLTGSSCTFNNLMPALYDVTVTGLDSGGNQLETGTGTVVFVRDPAGATGIHEHGTFTMVFVS